MRRNHLFSLANLREAPTIVSVSHLFAYGTLQVPSIFRAIVGREASASRATLTNYSCGMVRGEVYPGATPRAGAIVEGLLYADLDPTDFALLDEYEGSLYERKTLEVLVKGQTHSAQVYLVRSCHLHQLSDEPWSLLDFVDVALAQYPQGKNPEKLEDECGRASTIPRD